MKKVYALCLMIILSSCGYSIVIGIENQSNRNVVFVMDLNSGSIIPDTVLPVSYEREEIKKKSFSLFIAVRHSGKQRDLGDMYQAISLDTVYYYFIDADTLSYYGAEDVRTHNRILVRYDLSIDDVELLKETIPYPPTPAMRDMKMYPPYEEVLRKEEEYDKQYNIVQP
jgi:hypothetical protein